MSTLEGGAAAIPSPVPAALSPSSAGHRAAKPEGAAEPTTASGRATSAAAPGRASAAHSDVVAGALSHPVAASTASHPAAASTVSHPVAAPAPATAPIASDPVAAPAPAAAPRTRKPASTGRVRRTVLAFVIPVIIFVAWTAATAVAVVPSSILPSPAIVASTFTTMISDGTLSTDLSVSLVRVVVGYAVASAIGITIGTLCGMFRTSRELLLPIITAVRQIPLLAWIPLLILWCGIGELSKVVFIVLAAFFPIMMNTMEGIASTPLEYIEVARLNKLSPWKTFVRVYLPHALPHIQTGLKLGLGISWMAVVGAELIASTSGIGYRMSYARTLMQSDVVIVCMLVVGVIGIVMDKGVTLLFSALTPWERKGRDRS